MAGMMKGEYGIDVTHKNGRKFVVTYNNIGFYELDLNEDIKHDPIK